jgi:hypothetical protein
VNGGSESAAPGLSSFWLKIIAVAGMTLQHGALVFEASLPLGVRCAMHFPGGLTFPIMAFLLTDGYARTSDFKNYAGRMLMFALAAQAPFMLIVGERRFNVLFTLLFGLILLWLKDRIRIRPLFLAVFIGMVLISRDFDWPIVGLPLILMCASFEAGWRRAVFPALTAFAVLLLTTLSSPGGLTPEAAPNAAFCFGSLAAIPLLSLYNGKRGPGAKYFFYFYYPVHMLALITIKSFLARS